LYSPTVPTNLAAHRKAVNFLRVHVGGFPTPRTSNRPTLLLLRLGDEVIATADDDDGDGGGPA
jgi:hypothetical protein